MACGGMCVWGCYMSLRLMLTMTVIAAVLIIAGLGAATDYVRESNEHAQRVILSLQEQVGALKAAYTRMSAAEFAIYTREACAATKAAVSPGHHIFLIGPDGRLLQRSHNHAHPEIEAAVLAAGQAGDTVRLADHTLAQARAQNADGTTIVTVEYLDAAEALVRAQLLSRGVTTAAIAFAVIGLLLITINRWVLVPVARLSETAKDWGCGNLSTRAPLLGSRDIRTLGAEFNSMADRLEIYANELQRSNEDLQQFAYVASHDLKEPLFVVTMYLHLLETSCGDKLDPESKEHIRCATDGAQRMQAMINDLLDYARLGTQPVPPEPTESARSLQQALHNLGPLIKEATGQITAEDMPLVLADEGQLVRVFQNLVGNALKFRGHATPRIHVAARREDPFWVFSVRDNGIGIDPREAERIFQIFQRAHTCTESSGNGIGLAVCRRIVEGRGGRIWVESSPGQGSTFFFTLPVVECPTAKQHAAVKV